MKEGLELTQEMLPNGKTRLRVWKNFVKDVDAGVDKTPAIEELKRFMKSLIDDNRKASDLFPEWTHLRTEDFNKINWTLK